jgi:hypothetical protein
MNMTAPRFEDQSDYPGSYDRSRDQWRSEDDWGLIAAAVLFLIILAGLIIYGSINPGMVSIPGDATTDQSTPAPMPPHSP